MGGAWARGADGIVFPLCRSTAFKLTFEESINKRHSVGLCRCPRLSITEQTSLPITTSFSWEKNSLNSLWWFQKKHISLSWWRRFYPFSVKPKSSVCFLDKFKSQTRSLKSPCVKKWGSGEEKLASNVGSQSTLSPLYYPWSSSLSELSSSKVRFSEGIGTGNSSLCGTALIAVG